MPMKMGWRWYGEGNDPITLNDIKQIPGVTSIVWALHNKMPGEIWEIDEIQKVADQIHAYGFDMDVVESVNVHDDIKIGLPTRDKYIENYKQCIRNLSKFGVKVICYNFMPIFDWTRTDLFHPVGDGSTALFYQKDMIQDDYKAMADYILGFTEKYHMTFPGWEPERMAKLDELFKAYAPVTKEKLWENLKYFLEALMPTCRECDIKMAIHMDDPPWDIFGLPRLLVDAESIDRFLSMVDDEYNCLTLCSGSLNANPNNNVAEIVRKHCDRITFAHIRNILCVQLPHVVQPPRDLVNIDTNLLQFGGLRPDVGGVDVDNITIYQHLPGVGRKIPCVQQSHLLPDKFLFLRRHGNTQNNFSGSVRHSFTSFLGGLGYSPASISAGSGYTPYACSVSSPLNRPLY